MLAVCRKVLNSVGTTVLVDGRHDYVDILRSFYRTTSNWEPLSVITVSSWSVERRRNKLRWICNSYLWPSVIINIECQGSHMQHCGKVLSNQLLFSPRHQVWNSTNDSKKKTQVVWKGSMQAFCTAWASLLECKHAFCRHFHSCSLLSNKYRVSKSFSWPDQEGVAR